ncbi:DnaJ domain-containing protein [Absidia repens]|uniref:DnaJ domain-containing protein n=1 Tax=Absidia repens TaxID=90262 RepID=A0A1X2I4I1_9FUNG|nr:DnaJ domain-containing protein [Absidia repens]
MKKAIKARERGNDLFKLGYYREAEKSYNQALALLPDRHDITAIISNNRAAARLKNGQYRQCVMDCTFVVDWTRQKCLREGKASTIKLDDGTSIRCYDQLGKALHRKAEALEKMLRTTDAQYIYEELVDMDSGDTKALTGLQRCQSTTETKPPPPPSPFSKPTSTNTTTTPTHGAASSSSAFPGLDYSIFESQQPNIDEPPPSKAVAAMRARQAKMATEETERQEKMDMVNLRIDAWKRGKEKNIRALLSSLNTVLWSGAQWNGVPINELQEPRKVKMCYMKAISKVHPDKLPSSTTVEQCLLASGVFSVLNQAWDDFRSHNTI